MGKREREFWGEEGVKDPSEKNRMGISTRVSIICRKEIFRRNAHHFHCLVCRGNWSRLKREYGVKRVFKISDWKEMGQRIVLSSNR